MTEHNIESDVPIPERSFYASKYPVNRMDVGDSFAFDPDKFRGAQSAIAREEKRSPGKKFITRKVNETESRTWRTK